MLFLWVRSVSLVSRLEENMDLGCQFLGPNLPWVETSCQVLRSFYDGKWPPRDGSCTYFRVCLAFFLGGQWSISVDFSQNQHCLEMFWGMVFGIHVNTNTEGHVARHSKGPNRSRTAGQLELVENPSPIAFVNRQCRNIIKEKRMNISQNKVFTQSTYQIWSWYPTSCSRLHHVVWLEGVKTQDNSKDGTETDKHSATLTKGTVGASGLWHEIGAF